MKQGVLVVNKDWKTTSFAVVARVKKILAIPKAGHLGTLDPMARGVLPIALGSATRLMDFMDTAIKIYDCSARLGLESDTMDIWGEVRDRAPALVSEDALRKALQKNSGLLSQLPPAFSARKKDGRRLYEYARAGQKVEGKKRTVYIQAQLTEYDPSDFAMQVVCSRGTYIRTLCASIGEDLHTGACMTGLTRVADGVFTLERALTIEELAHMDRDQIESRIVPIPDCLPDLGKARVRPEARRFFRNGVTLRPDQWTIEKAPTYATKDFYLPLDPKYRTTYRVSCEEEFLGLASASGEGSLRPIRIFNDPESEEEGKENLKV